MKLGIRIFERILSNKSKSSIGESDPILEVLNRNQKFWEKSLKKARSGKGKKILIATSMSAYLHGSSLDRRLAISLTNMGHQVAFILCDAQLKACQIVKFADSPTISLLEHRRTPRCHKCAPLIESKFKPLGLPIFSFSSDEKSTNDFVESISDETLDSLSELVVDGVPIGSHARAGAIRYFASSNLENEVKAREILLRFIYSAITVMNSLTEIIKKFAPDTIIAHHGIYIPQGVLADVSSKFKIPIMTWTPSYRKGTFIFSPHETYHYSLGKEDVKNWEKLELHDNERKKLKSYMESRSNGEQDWIRFSDSRIESIGPTTSTKEYFLALTSVSWDAELHYKNRAFPDMKKWLQATVEYFILNPKLELIIRIHPAEITSPNKSREKMFDFLRSIGAINVPNILIYDSDSAISTYDLIRESKTVLIYNTKTGIEAAYMGKPVVTAGEAWIKGKGISYDAYSKDEYIEILENLSRKNFITQVDSNRAEKYAFHFFFRRMIRLNLYSEEETKSVFPSRELSWNELIGANDPNYQEILNSILENRVPHSKVI